MFILSSNASQTIPKNTTKMAPTSELGKHKSIDGIVDSWL
ncbi:hypothetical protein CDUR_10920 [Corynebacterium durum]|nr:hypothetical protein [Corynebacterium durum]WJY85902.1 hypothetical protein CDUR_10920 [Corynebacterium durum]